MDVQTGTRATAFLAAAGPWVTRDPVRHNVLATVSAEAALADAALHWAVASHGGTVVGAAVSTPPRHALLTTMPAAAARAIAEAFAAAAFTPSGATGPLDEVQAFATAWCARTGQRLGPRVPLGIYRADAVEMPPDVPGSIRPAGEDDVDLLTGWVAAFQLDVEHVNPRPAPEAVVRTRMAGDRLRLWVVAGTPVAMAASAPPVDAVSRVMLVYTPPQHRRRGYAGAVTAAVTRQELSSGARACMLYTDRANATSNAVYRRIGYVDLGDHAEVAFES